MKKNAFIPAGFVDLNQILIELVHAALPPDSDVVELPENAFPLIADVLAGRLIGSNEHTEARMLTGSYGLAGDLKRGAVHRALRELRTKMMNGEIRSCFILENGECRLIPSTYWSNDRQVNTMFRAELILEDPLTNGRVIVNKNDWLSFRDRLLSSHEKVASHRIEKLGEGRKQNFLSARVEVRAGAPTKEFAIDQFFEERKRLRIVETTYHAERKQFVEQLGFDSRTIDRWLKNRYESYLRETSSQDRPIAKTHKKKQ